MKKIFIIVCSVILVATGIGCSKFLDKSPTSTLSPVNYYSNEAEVNAALAGTYNILCLEFMWGGRIPIRHNASTDESFFSYTSFPTGPFWYNYDATDATVTEMWTYLYQGIERANTLLASLDKATMDKTKKATVRGETLFLRAFYYFTLVQYWGDVPLKLTPSTSVNDVDIARTSTKDVYAQILKDMQEAEGLVLTCGQTGNTERISKSTVRGLLARVCLTMAGEPLKDVSKYKDARDWAQKVMQSGDNALNADYKQIFINECADIDDNKECIWETGNWGSNNDANRIGGRIGNENGVKCSATDPANVGYAYGFISTSYKLYNLYATNDLRRDWAISTYTLSATGVKTNIAATSIYTRNCAKWRREYEVVKPMNKNYTPTNFPILRYADVLLMFAEADNEVNSGPSVAAYDAINQVRRRGYGLPTGTANATVDFSGLSQATFRQRIQDERARELCFEGLRKPDLIRWGLFLTAMQDQVSEIQAKAPTTYQYAATAAARVSARNLLYPIPAKELSLNKACTQNPGY
ncbi:MAG: RagB/SusD family nutrient uptake outer membrane protein [Filimonas sp.]|nr:RagB/SusD family nutrient uptake outer membrane protein [Filimonas sp.]